jgi:hypothetical protein
MNPAALAFASGALLFLTSTAVVSLGLSGADSPLWWGVLAAVASCHGGMGFLAMGGAEAAARGRRSLVAFCATTSALVTTAASALAALVASLFPIALGRGVALVLLAASVSAGCALLAVVLADYFKGSSNSSNLRR